MSSGVCSKTSIKLFSWIAQNICTNMAELSLNSFAKTLLFHLLCRMYSFSRRILLPWLRGTPLAGVSLSVINVAKCTGALLISLWTLNELFNIYKILDLQSNLINLCCRLCRLFCRALYAVSFALFYQGPFIYSKS